MAETKNQKSLFPIPRRTFLATASLGMVAGLSDRSSGRTRWKSADDVLESLSLLVNRELRESKSDLYLRAAIELQSAEMEASQIVLRAFARDSYKSLGFDGNLAMIALCKMLFTKRASLPQEVEPEFRRARIGAPGFLGETSAEDWLLEPIEIVDGVPFLIVDGYMLFGSPEHAYKYIEYCIDSCDWNSYKFTRKSSMLKQAALDKLLASSKWKQKLSKRDKEFLSAQIQ